MLTKNNFMQIYYYCNTELKIDNDETYTYFINLFIHCDIGNNNSSYQQTDIFHGERKYTFIDTDINLIDKIVIQILFAHQ